MAAKAPFPPLLPCACSACKHVLHLMCHRRGAKASFPASRHSDTPAARVEGAAACPARREQCWQWLHCRRRRHRSRYPRCCHCSISGSRCDSAHRRRQWTTDMAHLKSGHQPPLALTHDCQVEFYRGGRHSLQMRCLHTVVRRFAKGDRLAHFRHAGKTVTRFRP